MIKFTPENIVKVHTIFNNQYNKSDRDVVSVLDIATLISTFDVKVPVLAKSVGYWEFLHACLNHIETNTWTTLPSLWLPYLCQSTKTELLSAEIDLEYSKYLKHRTQVLTKLDLDTNPSLDRLVMLHWLRGKKSDVHVLAIAEVLLRVYLYAANVSFKNMRSTYNSFDPKDHGSGQSVMWSTSIDDADALMSPLKGDNKEEILRNSFNNGLPDKMI